MSKHTPAPWHAANLGDQGWTVLSGDTIVAIIGGGNNGEDFDPAYEADARLTAAAPDLLVALMELLRANSYYFPAGNPWGDQARAAIAKSGVA